MGEQPEMFNVERVTRDAVPWPDWFNADAKSTSHTQSMRVAQGRHPMGSDLGPVDSRCRDCQHFAPKDRGRRYLKCSFPLHARTSGPATDIRAGWRGCVHHQEEGEADVSSED